jgi:hypothetical protein
MPSELSSGGKRIGLAVNIDFKARNIMPMSPQQV